MTQEVSARPRPLLVGELNPFGGDESFALYPLPEHCSGGRLQRILGLSITRYLRLFDRANLCRGRWSLPAARARVVELLQQPRPAVVLLGAKVCASFGVGYEPFAVGRGARGFTLAVLPHPSGLNRAWNNQTAVSRARAALWAVGARLRDDDPATCLHREASPGPRVLLRHGSAPTEFCLACGSYRTLHHSVGLWLPGPPDYSADEEG